MWNPVKELKADHTLTLAARPAAWNVESGEGIESEESRVYVSGVVRRCGIR